MMRRLLFVFIILLFSLSVEAKYPDLTPAKTTQKLNEVMKAHASHKELNSEIIRRALNNYLDILDPAKTYFIESDIHQWLEPSDALVDQIIVDYRNNQFSEFEKINGAMVSAIERRRTLDKQIQNDALPKKVPSSEFKDMKWVTNESELLDRLKKIRSLQIETSTKLNDEDKDKAFQRIAKHQAKREEEFLNMDQKEHQNMVLVDVLKAFTSALDSHTAYFTPEEASQFMINVQQRLFGIGAQLRDDINGFSVVKIIEGGPAYNGKELKAKDRIIAVNGEPVVGMDIVDAVQLIRGPENTEVVLTVIREVGEDDDKHEEKRDITIHRGEVVLKESRYESSYEPFGDGVIGYLHLYSFYQDPEYSSAADLLKQINELKKDHKLKGIILDLRSNSGGMLSQAVSVTGLFIGKGVVVSIKDNTGAIQHLRNLDGKPAWDGPLVVLINRASASASEIVAQTLQDYGRALIVGDTKSYGKGSFQTFTLNTTKDGQVNPEGEYKVTRGRYYTVSGKTPQLTGVLSDIVVPGALAESELGENQAKYPLENDRIKPNFDDDLSDIPFFQREKIRLLYKFDLQQQLKTYDPYLPILAKNSEYRVENNKNYQNFLKEIKKKDASEEEDPEEFGQNDLQLTEAYNIMKDLIILSQ